MCPDSSKTLVLYKSCTYKILLLYNFNQHLLFRINVQQKTIFAENVRLTFAKILHQLHILNILTLKIITFHDL